MPLLVVLALGACGDEDAAPVPVGDGAAGSRDADGRAGAAGRPYAPVPEGARGLPVDPSKGYLVTPFGEGLYGVTNGIDQAAFLATDAGVVVLDAPPSLADGLGKAIREVTAAPVTHVVYSHYHADHIGGAARVAPPGAAVIAHEATARALAREADPNRPAPTLTFADAYALEVGGRRLELAYRGPNHVDGNLFIYAPASRALMAVDLVWPGWVPFFELGQAEDVPGYRASFDLILQYDFDVFVGGHVGRYGTRADVEQTKAYVDDLFRHAAEAIGAVGIDEAAAQVGYENPFVLVDRWFSLMKGRCAGAVQGAWVGRLGAADVWADSHCLAALQSLRID
ncbi:MAG TPA: MBL fold metallo-hydrolase [Polyangiaceae bacterium]|nr:MBL fold metallo-hydrolase [Polyangiaceae bacterium]